MSALLDRFNALGTRERIGIAIALVAVIYVLFDALLIGPINKRHKALKTEAEAIEARLTAAKADMVVVKAQFEKDPQAKDRAQLDSYKKAMEEADRFVANVESDPNLVGALLRQILAGSPGLTLVSLKMQPAIAVIDSQSVKAEGKSDKKGNPAEPRKMYKRAIELTVKGNYMALLPYLEKLQRAPMHVLWAEADLGTISYPDSNFRLVIYTLSKEAEVPLG